MLQIRKIFLRVRLNKFYSQDSKMREIHKIARNIDQYANIKINCCSNTIIQPVDLFDYPNSNKLIIACPNSINIKGDDKNLEINEDFCINSAKGVANVIEVPIKCNLEVKSKQDVSIFELYSDYISVKSQKNIFTKSLRSTEIDLSTEYGNIICNGITLAHKVKINTNKRGSIHLDKIQGDSLHCTTHEGTISTNSCYAEISKFTTENGNLNLNNIHKKSTVNVLKEGDINMTGIHGNLVIKANGGNLNLQFSEIFDDNIILANDSKNVLINISDIIEESCFVELNSDEIILDDSALHLSNCLENDRFRLGKKDSKNKLLVCTKGKLTLGKLSWADSIKLKLKDI